MIKTIFKNSVRAVAFSNLLILVFLFSSCEKVIDIDLNAKAPKIVIEGSITDQPGPYTVELTQTVNYDESNNFPKVSGAIVTISDNFGNSELLAETSSGVYTTSTIQGTPGRTYTLKVIANEKEYSATSTMHLPVNIDKIRVVAQNLPMGNKKVLYVEFIDPAGLVNYYRFVKIINNQIQTAIFVEDDRTQDGKPMNIGLLDKGQNDVKLKTGDSVNVILQSLDENMYNYFRTLLQLNSGGLMNQSSSPANPLSNFNNGALGYFNACAVTSKTIKIQ